MGKDVWSFPKLTGPENWKEWDRNMFYALNGAGLWDIVSGDDQRPSTKVVAPDEEPLTPKELREQQLDYDRRNAKAVGKIGAMCSSTMQLNCERTWTAHQMYQKLKKECQPTGWNNKWELMSRIEGSHLSKCKSMVDFTTQMYKFAEEVKEIGITIDEYLTIKTLNSLSSQYETSVTLLSQKARDETKLPSLHDII